MTEKTEKIIILGGRGMLGSEVAKVCLSHGLDTVVLDLPDFDITNERHLTDAVGQAGAVINCAAYTNVEKAENEANLTYRVNAEAVGRLGIIAKKTGSWVLHVSTDFVFDGRCNRPYTETDMPNPINIYGKSKLDGEELLIKSGCRYCIIRTEWTYGIGGNNFVTKLLSLVRDGKKLRVVDDQVGSATATVEVAKVICRLLAERIEGMFHFASAGYASRFEIAKFISKTLGISVDLSRCKSCDYVSVATRPMSSRFNCNKIQGLLDEPIKQWQESLESFLRQNHEKDFSYRRSRIHRQQFCQDGAC